MILSRGKAAEALRWTCGVLERLKLTRNEKKTSLRDARQQRFDFLGYTFGPRYSRRTGVRSLGYRPSSKSVQRLRENVRTHLRRGNTQPWEEVCDRLNQKLPGWEQYFRLGRPWAVFDLVDAYVEDRVRHFLRKRHKVSSQGTRQFSRERIYGELGVFRLRNQLGATRS